MKLKQLASFIPAITLVAIVLGTVIVFAPPGDLVFPSLINTFVTNNGPDEAVPVNVTNQLESLEVTVPGGVEITNTQPIDVKVTNVLEPQEGTITLTDVDFYFTWPMLDLNTEGYREITILFKAEGNACVYYVLFHIGDEGDRTIFTEDTLIVEVGNRQAVTYSIRGPRLEVHVYCNVIDGLADATIYYYMTA